MKRARHGPEVADEPQLPARTPPRRAPAVSAAAVPTATAATATARAAKAKAKGKAKAATPAAGASGRPAIERFTKFALPVMSAEDVAPLTVPFAEIQTRLRPTLQVHGVAVVTDVANPETVKSLERLFALDLAELLDAGAAAVAGADFAAAAAAACEDPRHFPLASLPLLGPMERCANRGLPQGQFAWSARLLDEVKQVYALLHGTDDLVSSCDNAFFAPVAHRLEKQNRAFPHVDQNCHDERWVDAAGRGIGEWESYQGILYVWPSTGEHASTTVVWPGSHQAEWDTMMADPKVERAGKRGNHFVTIESLSNVQELNRLAAGWQQKARRLPVPAGALVLWDSKLMHQGWRGGPRLAQPVCWEPASRRPAGTRERKLRIVALGLPSTHWASLGMPHSVLGKGPEHTAVTPAEKTKAGLCLPLRPSLRPLPLAPNALDKAPDLLDRLRAFKWDEPLPDDLRETLEASICDDYKKHL